MTRPSSLVALRAVAFLALVAVALLAAPPAMARAAGEQPVAISIPAIGVDAPIEVRTTVRNQMQDPTGPDVVAWYDDSAKLGAPGNVVVAGHLDYAGVGPAVFARLAELERDDLILVTDEEGEVHRYRVVGWRTVDAVNGDWVGLTGPTERPTLTLITCAPPWDPAIGHYANRLVVRAVRIRS